MPQRKSLQLGDTIHSPLSEQALPTILALPRLEKLFLGCSIGHALVKNITESKAWDILVSLITLHISFLQCDRADPDYLLRQH